MGREIRAEVRDHADRFGEGKLGADRAAGWWCQHLRKDGCTHNLEPRSGRAQSRSGSTEPETLEAHNVHADGTYRDNQLSPPSPILFPATMRNSRLDVPVTLASPRIGLQARWVSVFDADGHDHLEMRWTATG